jgi:hypothetical protein
MAGSRVKPGNHDEGYSWVILFRIWNMQSDMIMQMNLTQCLFVSRPRSRIGAAQHRTFPRPRPISILPRGITPRAVRCVAAIIGEGRFDAKKWGIIAGNGIRRRAKQRWSGWICGRKLNLRARARPSDAPLARTEGVGVIKEPAKGSGLPLLSASLNP